MPRFVRHTVFQLQKSLLLLVLAAPAIADTGSITVEVIDAVSRRPIDRVTVTAEARDGSSQSVTSENGAAVINNLPIGFFTLRAESAGYITAVEPTVQVLERRTGLVRFELQPVTDDLDEIIVVARAREADPLGPVSSSFRNREELRNAAGSGSDVMRALSGLPGLASRGGFANFSVRGHGPKNNLIFVDGFPFQQVVHFQQSVGEEEDIVNGGRYSIFAPNAVSGAEFSPGGWSAAFGGQKASLLQLELVDGAPSPIASMRVDLAGLEFIYEGPSGFRDDTTLFLQAREFDFGQLFETIGQEDFGSPVMTDVIFKTHTQIDADDEFEFLAIYAPETFNRDAESVLAGEEEEEGIEDLSLVDVDQDLALVGATWSRLFGNDGRWTNRVYFRDFDKVSSEGEAFPDLVAPGTPADQVPVRENLLTLREKESEIGWRSDISVGNRLGLFTAGLRLTSSDIDYSTELREDWIRYVFESDDPRPPGQNFIVLQPEEIDSAYSASETNYAVYGEQVFEFGGATFRTGLRYDRNSFGDENLLSPRIAFNYTVSPRLRLSASTGIFYEAPSNLARAADPENFDLESEELTHFGLGLNYEWSDDISMMVEAYYQQLDNLLVPDSRTNARVSNAGKGTNTGVDVVLTRRFARGWSADLAYSWNQFRVDDDDGRGEYDANFNREHFLSVGGRWEISKRWQLSGRWRYGSGQPADRYITYEDVLAPNPPVRFSREITETNVARSDAFHSLDLRVDYRRPIGPVDFVLFLDILNMYGGPSGEPPELNILRGDEVSDDGDSLPLLGLIFEYAW
ncbi:MAG: TonB-dependent receptor [Pseudomonadota bacterium]